MELACGLCGLPEVHALHARRSHPLRRRIIDGVRQHVFIASTEGPSDGRLPIRGSLRLPGWEPLDELGGVPLAEAYRHQGRFIFLWREPGSQRWRWGRVEQASGITFFGVTSRAWLHEALAEAMRQ